MNFNSMLSHNVLTSLFLLLLFVFMISCKHQSPQDKMSNTFTAKVAFNDSIYDFGTFSSDSTIQRHVFSFVNSGKVPAVILNVDPSCQCTSVKYTQEAVQPRKSGKVEVIFDGTGSAEGYFNKSIRIRINSSNVYILRIKGCIK